MTNIILRLSEAHRPTPTALRLTPQGSQNPGNRALTAGANPNGVVAARTQPHSGLGLFVKSFPGFFEPWTESRNAVGVTCGGENVQRGEISPAA